MPLATRSKLSALTGLVLVGMLSACGGGSDSSNPPPPNRDDHQNPPVASTKFDRYGLDVQLFSDAPTNSTGIQLGATIDSIANITFTNLDHQLPGQPAFDYNFKFPSGLPGGYVSGNLFTIVEGSSSKEINILTPSATKHLQNVLWRGKDDPTLFGIGLVGYSIKLTTENWPTSGTATYLGKAFQYIVDSNPTAPEKTTYALYRSDVTATVDYSAKTISFAIGANPDFINAIGSPDVLNSDPTKFVANYALTNLDLSGETFIQTALLDTKSGLDLSEKNNALTFFGPNAEEMGGFVHYAGDVTIPAGPMTRDQFVSFALVKQ